jgi:hypothetical protein
MTDITPPPELVQQWEEDWHHSKVKHIEFEPYIAAQAAQWGADQELEACCEYVYERLKVTTVACIAQELRAARRPKPPSLKEQALKELQMAYDTSDISMVHLDTIRRALESIND